MLFGRAFEQAWLPSFAEKTPGSAFFREWSAYKRSTLRVFELTTPGIACCSKAFMLLARFCSGRPHPHPPATPQPADQFETASRDGNDFVAYIDAIGNLDGRRCLLEWKTTSVGTRKSQRDC